MGDCTAGDHRDPARLDEGTTRAARRTRVPHSDWPPPQRRRRRSAPCDPQICCPTTMSIACRQDVHPTHATAHLRERCYAAASTSRSSPFGSATRPIGITTADWYPDPTRRYQFRWWDGSWWTHQVATNHCEMSDPIVSAPFPRPRTCVGSGTRGLMAGSGPAERTTVKSAGLVSVPAQN